MDESDFYGRLVPVRHDQIPALPEGSMTIPALKMGYANDVPRKSIQPGAPQQVPTVGLVQI